MIRDLLSRWPVIRQIQNGSDGTGSEAMTERTRGLLPKTDGAEVTRSICPYCGVGCGQLVYHKDGKLISIEGDPQSPISRGCLCPKGADTFELHTHSGRRPIPTALRVVSMFRRGGRAASLRRWAAISAVAGSLLTRMAWLRAGVASTHDWRQPLEISPPAKSWPATHPEFRHPSTKLAS